jgi:tetratricopeptide (TPR) repeat protein
LFETQVGNYTAAKKCLARCAPVYSSFVARAIETCCHAGKPAEGEEIANVLIDVQNKRLAALYGTPDPGNTEATSEQIKESRSDQLRFELSKVRFALGELQNKEGKFTDAEKTLKLIDDRANVNQLLRAQYIIALGQSLEGQQKYDEAIALYLTCKDATVNDGPVFERLTNTLAERPNLGQRERFETIEFLWRLGRYDRSTFTPASIQRLLDSAHTQNWDSSDLELMKEVRARALRVQGKSELGIDEKRFPTKDANTVNSVADCLLLADGEYLSGNCQNAVELTLQALTPENLPALQEHLESSAEERASFNVGGLINAGQFLGVETILKRCVTLISSHPQKWSKHAAVEKCALANFYLQTGRFHEAKNLTKEIVSTMNEDPDPFFSTGKQKSLAPYGTWYFPRRSIPKVYDLLELCGMYINARRPNDAKELAASVLNLQKKWLGAKNPDLIYTYEELARANRALNDHSQEKGCLLQTIALKAWNFTGKQILPDEDSKAYAALLSAEGKTAEARHLLTEKKIPDLYPDSYARNIFFYPIISRVRTYTINDEPHAIAVLKASIERNGAGNPETLEAISNLALLYWHAQRYDDAEKLLLQKLHILQDIEGRSGYRKATCLAELACLETSKHHYKRAKELLSRAEKSSAGPGAPEQLPEVLAGFAAVKFKLGEQEAARSLARVAVQKQYDSGIDLLMPDVFASSAKILAGTPLANKADEIAHTGTGRPIGKPWPQVYPGFFEIY